MNCEKQLQFLLTIVPTTPAEAERIVNAIERILEKNPNLKRLLKEQNWFCCPRCGLQFWRE